MGFLRDGLPLAAFCHAAGTAFSEKKDMSLRPSLVIGLILAMVGLNAARCSAWNSTGHEIVALIAYDHLSPSARTAIIAVLKKHPRLNEDLLHDTDKFADSDLAMFVRAATWPDMVRFPANPMSHTENHGRWHYIDFPFDQDGVSGPEPVTEWDGKSDPENLFQALAKARAELKSADTHLERKAIDLCWVEHLVGDIHQPLHSVSWYSKEFPNGDRGGNSVMIMGNDGVPINLHAYWDDAEGLSLEPADIRKSADRIEAAHSVDSLKGRVADLNVADWAKESFELAKTVVYVNGTIPHVTRPQDPDSQPSPPALPAGYADKALATADVRMALAGYRLAGVLEEVAKGL
jgi:hypothetical protein